MGVDLTTYRARIGTFRHSVGVDVVFVTCFVNFSEGLKAVGSVAFIGLLLLVAGIEPNPGPKEDGHDDKSSKEKNETTQITVLQEEAWTNTSVCLYNRNMNEQGLTPEALKGSVDKFNNVLTRLGLSEFFPGKITLQDVIAVDLSDTEENISECDYFRLPWKFLRQIITGHSEARDRLGKTEDDNDLSIFSSFDTKQNSDISPLDIIFVVYQCCDPIVRQYVCQKMYLCKLAMPFIYRNFADETLTPTVAVWALRTITVENVSVDQKSETNTEFDILELPTKVVAFARFGRPCYSKSKFLNEFLTNKGCRTFFNNDCNLGTLHRSVSTGHAEIFWLPNVGEKKDKLPHAITCLNLRGDIKEDFSILMTDFVARIADILVLFTDISFLNFDVVDLERLMLNFSSVTLILTSPLKDHEREKMRSFQTRMYSKRSEQTHKILSIYKGEQEQNIVTVLNCVTKTLSGCLVSAKNRCLEERLAHAVGAGIATDESSSTFFIARNWAESLYSEMKKVSSSDKWKELLTPVQSILSTHLGELLKRRARETSFRKTCEIDNKICETRTLTTKYISKCLRSFIECISYLSNDTLQIQLFLGWLNIFIERKKRHTLPPLMNRYQCALIKLQKLKDSKDINKSNIKEQEKEIERYEKDIEKASFSLDNFFREVGHIYDFLLESDTPPEQFKLPSISEITNTVALCLSRGHHLELLDGESFYMPYKWIKHVLENFGIDTQTQRVLSLSILGLQSSG